MLVSPLQHSNLTNLHLFLVSNQFESLCRLLRGNWLGGLNRGSRSGLDARLPIVEVILVDARLDVLELSHLEDVSAGLAGLHSLSPLRLAVGIMQQSRGPGVRSRIAEPKRLLGLLQVSVLGLRKFLSLLTVVVGDHVADGCARSVRGAIGMLLFRQHQSRLRLRLQESWLLTATAVGGLRAASGRLGSQGHLVDRPEVLLVSRLSRRIVGDPDARDCRRSI